MTSGRVNLGCFFQALRIAGVGKRYMQAHLFPTYGCFWFCLLFGFEMGKLTRFPGLNLNSWVQGIPDLRAPDHKHTPVPDS